MLQIPVFLQIKNNAIKPKRGFKNLHNWYSGMSRSQMLKVATPKWVDRKAIKLLYKQARLLTITNGIQHEVDHIIPLKGHNVCGLHILENLQIKTRTLNRGLKPEFQITVKKNR